STTMTFTETLAKASPQDITVQYTTTNNTAIAGTNYVGTSGSLTIPAGQTTGTVSVKVLGDGIDTVNESFYLDISNASHGTITRSRGVGSITDSNGPGVTINNITLQQPTSGLVPATFTVRIAQPSPQDIRINYATQDGTAIANLDYLPAS